MTRCWLIGLGAALLLLALLALLLDGPGWLAGLAAFLLWTFLGALLWLPLALLSALLLGVLRLALGRRWPAAWRGLRWVYLGLCALLALGLWWLVGDGVLTLELILGGLLWFGLLYLGLDCGGRVSAPTPQPEAATVAGESPSS